MLFGRDIEVLGQEGSQLAGRPSFIRFNLTNRTHRTASLIGQFLMRQVQLPATAFEPGAEANICVRHTSFCCKRRFFPVNLGQGDPL